MRPPTRPGDVEKRDGSKSIPGAQPFRCVGHDEVLALLGIENLGFRV